MTRLFVPVTIYAGIVVDTDDKDVAMREARRFAESCGPDGHFVDGWNDTQRLTGGAEIYAVGDFDVEFIEARDVEEAEIDDA